MGEKNLQNRLCLSLYDADTCLGMPNFPPGNYVVNKDKEELLGYIYDKCVKVPDDGEFVYDYVLINNGKIIALGNERWRCGGITCDCKDTNFIDKLKKSPVYDKVRHLPIASSDELEEPIYRYFETYKEYLNYQKNKN